MEFVLGNQTNTTTPDYHDADLASRAWVGIFGSIFTFVLCTPSVYLYAKHHRFLRSPILDALVLSFVLAVPNSVSILSSSIFVLQKVSPDHYCNLSAYLFQQLGLTEVAMEGVFFAAMALKIMRYRVTYTDIRRSLAAVLVFGFVAFLVPYTTLKKFNHTSGVFSDVHQPYCWIPNSETPGEPASTKLQLYKFLFGFIFAAFLLGCGFFVLAVVIAKRMKYGVPISSALKWRLFYVILCVVYITVCFVPRVVGAYLSSSVQSSFATLETIFITGFPGVNALSFLLIEGVVATVRRNEESSSGRVYANLDGEDTALIDADENLSGINGAVESFATAVDNRKDQDDAFEAFDSRVANLEVQYDGETQAWFAIKLNDKTGESHIQTLEEPKEALLPKPPIGAALSFVAGYCDAVGFVTVDVFTAHVTGNTVLVGVHLANSKKIDFAKMWLKLAAIGVFIVTIAIAYSMGKYVGRLHRRILLGLQAALFMAAFGFAWKASPLRGEPQDPAADAAALVMVAGMAIQHTYQRTHLVGLPMTTFVTGNTNQLVHDSIELFRKRGEPASSTQALRKKWKTNAMCITGFFVGTVVATGLARWWNEFCYLPPVVAVIGILIAFWDETLPPEQKAK